MRLPAAVPVLVALVLGGCGDEDRRHPDWAVVTFPGDVEVSGPVEVPGGVTTEFHKYAVATSAAGLDPKQLTKAFRLTLQADDWKVSRRGDIRPGFSFSSPDFDGWGEVGPLRQLSRYLDGFGGRVDGLVRSTPDARRGVIVHLAGSPPEPPG